MIPARRHPRPACLLLALAVSASTQAANEATPTGAGLADALLSFALPPDLTLDDFDTLLKLEEKAVSKTRFGLGTIYEVPAKNPSSGIGNAVLHVRGADEQVVSVTFTLDQPPGQCASLAGFARAHNLAPQLERHVITDNFAAHTYFQGKVGDRSIVATPNREYPECVGELTVWTWLTAPDKNPAEGTEPGSLP